ncbi:calcium-binding protein [Halomonas cupida]|uniref:calcium-binding protein n=1 Tax=Halomonas cupida TaxID=44933 RepID=UPI003EF1B377
MPLFSVSKLNVEDAKALTVTAYELALYSNSAADDAGFSAVDVLETINHVSGPALESEHKIPSGWREVSAAELGLDASIVDKDGYITLSSPLLGGVSGGPQLKVLAEHDSLGNISRVCVSYAGTNNPVDIVDYFYLNEGNQIADTMEPVLASVASYMSAHGLSGDDAIITGYSLGGALTNIQARFSGQLADGFFAESNYMGYASPFIFEADNVLNVGFENDAVYRYVGDHEDLETAIGNLDGALENNDGNYSSSVDNLVIFDDVYASLTLFLSNHSVLNPFAWSAHLSGRTADLVSRIVSSSFYEWMSQDSVVVVAALGEDARGIYWVGDIWSPTSDHYGDPAFIVGSHFADLLAGSAANDYIDGLAGDDRIRASSGYNRVEGGSGDDALILEGRGSDYDVFKLDDGKVAALGNGGLTIAQGVETIEFTRGGGWFHSGPRVNYLVQDSHLEDAYKFSWFDRDIAYSKATLGDAGDNVIKGKVVFAGAGNDHLSGTSGQDVLVGEEGRDWLNGGGGSDLLYGGEGNDVIVLSAGNDRANGGTGQDLFVVKDGAAMHAVIEDFALEGEQKDILDLRDVLSDDAAFERSLVQVGDDSVVHFAGGTVRLEGVDAASLMHGAVLTGQVDLPDALSVV